MRHANLIALSAVALAVATPAAAQGRSPSDDRRSDAVRSPGRTFVFEGADMQGNRAALGLGTGATNTLRDTLGLLITSVSRGSPAEKAGLEEGNRISAINGVSLRASAADLEDYEAGRTLSRRLVRELAKAKPGDEVELRVYRDGRTQAVKVRTAHSDSLFLTGATSRMSRADMDDRPALGIGLGSSGSRRDTLGVLVISVQDSTPAARAGLEEGNRIAAINGVNLRVAREDAGDPSVGQAKAQRLRREVSQLKPNDNVTLRVYANGQFRDVTMKVARAGDLPRGTRTFFGGGEWFFPEMPAVPATPAMPPMPPMPRVQGIRGITPIHLDVDPAIRERLHDVRVQLDELRPELARIRPELARIRPEIERMRPELERIRPQLDRLRSELPRMLEGLRVPDVRVRVDGWGMTI